MSPHQTIAVAVRLFAIWLVIYFAQSAPSFFRESVRTDDIAASVAVVVISILAVLLALFLWFFPRTVARGLLDSKGLVRRWMLAHRDLVDCSGSGLRSLLPLSSLYGATEPRD
jgi:hypothetical protein